MRRWQEEGEDQQKWGISSRRACPSRGHVQDLGDSKS